MIPITQIQSPANHPIHRLKDIHIMILNSSPKAAELLRNMSAHFGFSNTSIANDAGQAVNLLRAQQVDVIFMDQKLKVYRKHGHAESSGDPDSHAHPISGMDFVRRLRFAPTSPSPYIPVVMLLEEAQPSSLRHAWDAGIDEIVLTPIKAGQFCERMASLIKAPRIFITAATYKGPCRRRQKAPLPSSMPERRTKEVRLVRRK